MTRLSEHTRDHRIDTATTDSRANIFDFPRRSPLASSPESSEGLDLLSKTAEVLRGMEVRAAETETRAKALAQGAVEKLKVAWARIQSAEAERDAARKALSKVSARLQQLDRELTKTQSRVGAAESMLAKAEQRTKAAETRAIDAEKTLDRIESAIRTLQLLGLEKTDQPNATRGLNERDSWMRVG
jgi:chromosome segregation ATPase